MVLTPNGRTMRNARQLEAYIYRSPMKQKITLQVLRGQDQLSIDVPVMESVDDPQRFADMVNPEDNLVPKLGILGIGIDKSLAAMLPGLRNSYGVVVAAGSSVTDLTSGTGLQPGDVIYSVNQAPVATVEALQEKGGRVQVGRRGGDADRTFRTVDVRRLSKLNETTLALALLPRPPSARILRAARCPPPTLLRI